MTSAEEFIAAGLERQLGSVPSGRRLLLVLDAPITDRRTHRQLPGPHVCGWLEKLGPDRVKIRLVPTEAGRTARALLEEELLDVALSRDSVRLADGNLQHERSQERVAPTRATRS
jgi:hypothetical protein